MGRGASPEPRTDSAQLFMMPNWASNIATSRYCPSPVRSRWYSAVSSPIEEYIPVEMSAMDGPILTTSPASVPVIDMRPVSACMTMSYAGHVAPPVRSRTRTGRGAGD